MKLWTLPQHYIGARWDGYYVFLGQNRDSDALTQSNFRTALERLGGESGEDDNGVSAVTVVSENHWACGWVEWIAIHQTNTEGIKIAEEMERQLEQYPILSEEDFSELESDECAETWEKCFDAAERVRYLRRHSYTAQSIGDLLRAVKGSWYHAANMLHCPSDILY